MSQEPQKTVQIVCQLFYPELISTGQTLTELAEKLAARGVDVEVLCAPPTVLDNKLPYEKKTVWRGIKIQRVWGTSFPKLNLAGRLINQITFAVSVFFQLLFSSGRQPILALTNPPFLGPICGFISKLKKRPFIYLIFDVYPNTLETLGIIKKNGFFSVFFDLFNKYTFRLARYIVVIGRCMKEIIAAKAADCAEKIKLIHIWGDDEYVKPVPKQNNSLLWEWGLKDKFVISYTGNMGRAHDIESIIFAAEKMERIPVGKEIVFLFVGKGQKKEWAQKYCLERKMRNVVFKDHVAKECLPQMLSLADLGIVSLLGGQEGLSVPSKALGIMAAGVPFIAFMSEKSEIARIAEEENCGKVVRPGDVDGLLQTILNLKNDNVLLSLMGQNGRRAACEKYSLKAAVNAYLDLLQNTCGACR